MKVLRGALIDRASLRVEDINRRTTSGEVDARGRHARYFFEDSFNPAHTSRAGHAVN